MSDFRAQADTTRASHVKACMASRLNVLRPVAGIFIASVDVGLRNKRRTNSVFVVKTNSGGFP